jgi:hypothetical protein
MRENAARRVVVVVRGGARAREIKRWLRALLPTAVLVASPGALPLGDAGDACDVVTVDGEAADAGPLSLAATIARGLRSRPEVEAAPAPLPPSGR